MHPRSVGRYQPDIQEGAKGIRPKCAKVVCGSDLGIGPGHWVTGGGLERLRSAWKHEL